MGALQCPAAFAQTAAQAIPGSFPNSTAFFSIGRSRITIALPLAARTQEYSAAALAHHEDSILKLSTSSSIR